MNTVTINPLVCLVGKLSLHSVLSLEDRVSLLQLPYSSRIFEAGSFLLRDGDVRDDCGLLVSGIACRHKLNADGQRQIVAMHIPGEIVDLQQLYVDIADSNVQTLTSCEVAKISHSALRQLIAERPSIGHTLVVSALVELSLAREWVLNIGRRDARTRISHFLCEFAFRLGRHESESVEAYELPMTQEQLGDALGLTAVHINRMLKRLVEDGLIERSKRGITIPNWKSLVREAGFNSRYLHLVPDLGV